MHICLLKKMLVIGILVLFFGASTALAVEINTFSTKVIADFENSNPDIETFIPTDDVYIKHNKPSETINIKYMSIRNEHGAYGGGSAWDGLIKFDISSIPSGSDIISATLNLFYWRFQDTNPVGRPLYLYRVLKDWSEYTVTWYNQPSYASQWTTYSSVSSVFGWMTWEVTSDIQDFVDGEETNYGWKITDETYWGWYDIPTTSFRTKEYEDENFHPYLEIEFTRARSRDITNPFFFRLFEYLPNSFPILRQLLGL